MNSKRWVKLFQKLLKNPVFKDSELLHLFIFCLLKANYKPDQWVCGNQVIPLKPGQFVTGIHTIVEETNIKQTTAYRKMKLLRNLGIISIKAENKFSVITVNKYSSYQVEGKQTENKRKTNGKQTETVLEYIEEVEGVEVKKDIPAPVSESSFQPKKLFADSEYANFDIFKNYFVNHPDYNQYDAKYYFGLLRDYSASKNVTAADWVSYAYGIIRRDLAENKAVKEKELSFKEKARLAAEGKLAI